MFISTFILEEIHGLSDEQMLTFLIGKNSSTAVHNSLVITTKTGTKHGIPRLLYYPLTKCPDSAGSETTFFNALFSVDASIGGLGREDENSIMIRFSILGSFGLEMSLGWLVRHQSKIPESLVGTLMI